MADYIQLSALRDSSCNSVGTIRKSNTRVRFQDTNYDSSVSTTNEQPSARLMIDAIHVDQQAARTAALIERSNLQRLLAESGTAISRDRLVGLGERSGWRAPVIDQRRVVAIRITRAHGDLRADSGPDVERDHQRAAENWANVDCRIHLHERLRIRSRGRIRLLSRAAAKRRERTDANQTRTQNGHSTVVISPFVQERKCSALASGRLTTRQHGGARLVH
jgi:hypothetical protein